MENLGQIRNPLKYWVNSAIDFRRCPNGVVKRSNLVAAEEIMKRLCVWIILSLAAILIMAFALVTQGTHSWGYSGRSLVGI